MYTDILCSVDLRFPALLEVSGNHCGLVLRVEVGEVTVLQVLSPTSPDETVEWGECGEGGGNFTRCNFVMCAIISCNFNVYM